MKPLIKNSFYVRNFAGPKSNFVLEVIPIGFEMASKRRTDKQTNKQTDRQTDIFVFIIVEMI